jgi:imidazolonepropionase
VSTLVIRRIGQLCTCDPQHGAPPGVIENGALVSADGVLTFVGCEREIPAAEIGPDAIELDAGGCAVVPGFVDSHTHAVWMGDRSDEYALRSTGRTYEEIAAAGGGIAATVRATSAAGVDELAETASERARRMLRSGTTTAEVKSGYGLEHEAEMRQLDAAMRLAGRRELPDVVATYLPLHATPERDRAQFIDNVCDRGVLDASRRATFIDVYCDRGAFTVDECEQVLAAGQVHGLRAKVHAEQHTRTGGALLAARCSAVSADHLDHASDDDLRALAAAGVVGVILPAASLVLGGPPPPGRRLLEAGCRVAVATDCNPGTSYAESMPLMLSLAVATAGLPAAHALVSATAWGAAALALSDRGMLRVGMRCDAVVLRSRHWIDLGYHLGGDVVDRVVKAGVVDFGAEAQTTIG